MKHKVGDMFLFVDFVAMDGRMFKIAAIDKDQYQVIFHDGTWLAITDEEIEEYNFKKVWNANMDDYIQTFYS